MVENFDERLAIRQSFSNQSSLIFNASPLNPPRNLSNFCKWFICRSFSLSNFCAIRYHNNYIPVPGVHLKYTSVVSMVYVTKNLTCTRYFMYAYTILISKRVMFLPGCCTVVLRVIIWIVS